MPTYIVLLRGINVSGKNKLKMAELRAALSDLGYRNLQTYIQSGNIVFDTDDPAAGVVEAAVHRRIKQAFGYDLPVLALTARALQEIASKNPFQEAAEADGGRVLLSLLQSPPSPAAVDSLSTGNYGNERFLVQGRAVYLHCPDGYGRAKLNNNFLERKLGVPATTRNWKTIRKLLEMATR